MIIDRYLVRQVALPCIAVSVVLLIIFVGFSLSRFLVQADAGLLNTAEVVQLTGLKVLIALEVLLPIGLFFGLMLGLGKLHTDSEIYAMQASGMSESRMLRPVVSMALALAILIAVLSIYARPWAYNQTYLMLAQAEASSDIDRIKPAQFYLTRKSGTGLKEDQQRAIFIEKIHADKTLEGIFIRTRIGDELQLISSRRGEFKQRDSSNNSQNPKNHTLNLSQARIFKRVDDGPDLFAYIDEFRMNVANKQVDPPGYKAKSVSSAQLGTSTDPEDRAEYQWRISTPISTLLLALLAIPLSRSKPRHGRYAKLIVALLVYAAYYNLMGISRTWVEQQSSSNIWWVPALLGIFVLLAYTPWGVIKFSLFRRPHDAI